MAGPERRWNPDDPFVTDDQDCVVGLVCAPPHHAEWLAAGWEGGDNLFPLVAPSPEAFTADVLIYSRRGAGGIATRTATLPDEPPFVYLVSAGLGGTFSEAGATRRRVDIDDGTWNL